MKKVFYFHLTQDENEKKSLVFVPYNGEIYKLENCIITVKCSGECEFDLLNLLEDRKVVVGTIKIQRTGIQTVKWSNFSKMKKKLSTLEIRGKTYESAKFLCVEFNMTKNT